MDTPEEVRPIKWKSRVGKTSYVLWTHEIKVRVDSVIKEMAKKYPGELFVAKDLVDAIMQRYPAMEISGRSLATHLNSTKELPVVHQGYRGQMKVYRFLYPVPILKKDETDVG